MTAIIYQKLSNENFGPCSLDDFIRHQEVSEYWRNIDGKLTLVPSSYIEDWSIARCREIAYEITYGINDNGFGYGAFYNGSVAGYIYLSDKQSRNKCMEIQLFHVSEPFRRKGIGRKLFELACREARERGAESLFISAHPSRESQEAYRRLGCVPVSEIDRDAYEREPFVIQLEYIL